MPVAETAPRAAIVTGGAGQLGSAIVSALRARGGAVIVLDRPGPALDSVGAEPGVTAVPCDLTDAVATDAAVAEAWRAAGGPVPVLVNAVGQIVSAPLVSILAAADRKHSAATWRETIEANLTAVFIATAAQVDRMLATRTRGVVVSLSSIAAVGNPGQSAYAAAKAGVNAATSAWAKELGPMGIRFVAVAPGFIDTPSTHSALSEGAIKDWQRRTPLRRLGTAGEVASTVLFAIDNGHLTGKVLEIDGGLTI